MAEAAWNNTLDLSALKEPVDMIVDKTPIARAMARRPQVNRPDIPMCRVVTDMNALEAEAANE